MFRRSLFPPLLALTALPVVGQQLGGGFGKVVAGDELIPALETTLALELPKRVAEAEKWEVKISREGNNLLAGKIGHLEVRGVNVRTRDGMVLPEVALSIDNLKLDLRNKTISEVGESRLVGRLDGPAVTRFARRHAGKKLQDLQVQVRDGALAVIGLVDVKGFGIPVQVVGRPEVNGTGIDFRAEALSVAELKLPKEVVRILERQINPVVDLRGLKIPARITKVTVAEQYLVAEATLDFQGAPPQLGTRRERPAARRRGEAP